MSTGAVAFLPFRAESGPGAGSLEECGVVGGLLVVLPAAPGDAASSARANGQIAYDRDDPRSPDDSFVSTANSDGSRARRLMARHTCCPSWSHDGRTLAIPANLPGDRLTTATVGADGRSYKLLPIEDPTLSVACAGGAWSPDDTRLACESWDDSRPSRNGIYIRSSSAGSSTMRLTSSPGGGDLPDRTPRTAGTSSSPARRRKPASACS